MNNFSIENCLIPNGTRVFIKKQSVEERTESGLWKPKQMVEKENLQSNLGIIVAVGDLVKSDNCKVNTLVSFKGMTEMNMSVEGQDYIVIFEEAIICYFKAKESK